MNTSNKTYYLNGKSFSEKEIINFSDEQLAIPDLLEWQHDLYSFIINWFNLQDYILVSTSGSTGKPKIIKLAKNHMIESAIRTINFFELKSEQNALLCLSADNIAGKMMMIRAFIAEMNLITVEPQHNPITNINEIIDFAAMTPYQVFESIQEGENFKNIKKLIIGGGEISAKLHKKIQSLRPACFATYGMTETITHIALKRINGNNRKDFFTVLPDIKIRQNENNCLCISLPGFSNEIITNDIVELIDDTSFCWIGRLDNVINSGGVKIHPEQVESSINRVISDNFFLTSIPDSSLGEKLILIIESKVYDKNKSQQLKQKLTNILPNYHRPKEIIFIDTFIYTKSNKINRVEMAKQFLR